MRKIFQILIWTLLLLAVVVALAFIDRKHDETICYGFELVIEDQNPNPLIEAGDIRSKVIAVTDSLIGKTLGEINLHEINDILEEIPYVLDSDIQSDISGKLTIRVKLRQAVVRVVNHSGFSYYIDTEGWLMPVNTGYPSRVIIANGAIKDGISDLTGQKIHVSTFPPGSVVRKLHQISIYIWNSAFLKRLITQIWVNRTGEFELIPMLGEYTLKFGDFEGMEEKFEKLETFYREGAGKAGWIDYRSVDLRYKNQIICSKK